MFANLETNFTSCELLSSSDLEDVRELAEPYISTNGITNHRKRRYLLGGAVLLYLHNNTEKVYRPSDVAEHLGEDYSPSKVTFSAYKLSEFHNCEYEKPDSYEFAKQYAQELDCGKNVFEMISQLYEDVGELPGKSNSGTGAAFLYIATLLTNDKRTQQEIAEVSGRSEVGIRNLYYEIIEESSIDIK